MPACSAVATWYGPAISANRYVLKGGVSSYRRRMRPSACVSAAASRAFAVSVHSEGAVTVSS